MAWATVRGVPDVLVMRLAGHWATARSIGGGVIHADRHVTDIRPAVVLDLDEAYGRWVEDRDPAVLVERLRETRSKAAFAIAYQIEQQTKLSKPPEPTGLGAVVEDREGRQWLRTFGQLGFYVWRRGENFELSRSMYAEIDAVRVLSEGVTDAT